MCVSVEDPILDKTLQNTDTGEIKYLTAPQEAYVLLNHGPPGATLTNARNYEMFASVCARVLFFIAHENLRLDRSCSGQSSVKMHLLNQAMRSRDVRDTGIRSTLTTICKKEAKALQRLDQPHRGANARCRDEATERLVV